MGVSLKQGVVEEINTGLMIVNSLGECRRFETLNDIEMGRRLVWKFFFFLFFFSAPPPSHRIQNLYLYQRTGDFILDDLLKI